MLIRHVALWFNFIFRSLFFSLFFFFYLFFLPSIFLASFSGFECQVLALPFLIYCPCKDAGVRTNLGKITAPRTNEDFYHNNLQFLKAQISNLLGKGRKKNQEMNMCVCVCMFVCVYVCGIKKHSLQFENVKFD